MKGEDRTALATKLTRQTENNSFHLLGKLVDSVKKTQDKSGKIHCLIKMAVPYRNTVVAVPVIYAGKKSDAIPTLYHQNDYVEVKGMFGNMYGETVLIALKIRLIIKSQRIREDIDLFQNVISKYSIDAIERRKK